MVGEHTLYDFSSSRFAEVCFMVLDVVYLVYVLWALGKNLLAAVGWNVVKISVRYLDG